MFIFFNILHNNNGDYIKKIIIILLCVVTLEIYCFLKKNNSAKYVENSAFSFINTSLDFVYYNDSLLVNSYVMETPDNLSYDPNLYGLGFISICLFLIFICKNNIL